MQVDLKKYLFIGVEKDRAQFFSKAQDAGIIHFISRDVKKAHMTSPEVELITKALKILRKEPPQAQETLEEYLLGDGIAFKVVELNEKIEKYQEELRALNLEIARISPFGQFSLKELKALEKQSNRVVQFFAANPKVENIPDTAVYVNSDQGLDYYIAISPSPIVTKEMIEMEIDTPLDELIAREKVVQAELKSAEEKQKIYAKYSQFLYETLLWRLDRQNLSAAEAIANPIQEGDLFFIEGWVPVTKLNEMREIVDDLHVYAEEIVIDSKETIPTYMENDGLARVGEDLVHIYDTPAHNDKDPSIWVLFSFALFFAVIIGDAGYGLIFLASALFIRYKMGSKLQGAGKRVWKLLLVLSLSTILWGMFTNTFFAASLAPTNPLRAYSPLTWLAVKKIEYSMHVKDETYMEAVKQYANLAPVTDPREFLLNAYTVKDGVPHYTLADSLNGGIMMEIAIVIGMVHLTLSMLRYIRRTWAFAGWIMVLWGCFLYFPVYLESPSFINYIFGVSFETAKWEGLYLIKGGFVVAIALSIFQNKWLGLLEPMTAVQILADLLSYLRLYALALAGGIVAATVNEFVAASGFVIGALVALIGHTVNIALSIMGGVIHGLRLNFIEWYHYSFHGGGKRFAPLRKLSNTKKES